MKSQILPKDHDILPNTKIADVIWKKERIATVYGADGPGVRIISHLPINIVNESKGGLNIIDIRLAV
jgi:hypothetical protein